MFVVQTARCRGDGFMKTIREAGCAAVQRNTFHEPIEVWDAAPTATEAEPPLGKSKVLEDNLATA